MIQRNTLLAVLSSLLLLSSCQQNEKKQAGSDNARLEHFRDEFVKEMFRISPSIALNAGNHDYDTLLIIPTEEQIKEENHAWNVLLDSIKSFDGAGQLIMEQVTTRKSLKQFINILPCKT